MKIFCAPPPEAPQQTGVSWRARKMAAGVEPTGYQALAVASRGGGDARRVSHPFFQLHNAGSGFIGPIDPGGEIFQQPRRLPQGETRRWICAAFPRSYPLVLPHIQILLRRGRATCDEAGRRGLGIVVEEAEAGPTFPIQCRSIELRRRYRCHIKDLARPELSIPLR